MIQAREIMALAEELRLRPDVVEKDYVLGWLLHGIGSHPELAPAWDWVSARADCLTAGGIAVTLARRIPNHKPHVGIGFDPHHGSR